MWGRRRLRGQVPLLLSQHRTSSEVHPAGARETQIKEFECRLSILTRRADKIVGVRLASGSQTWEATFNTSAGLGGHIRRTGGRIALGRDLATTVQAQSGIMSNDQ